MSVEINNKPSGTSNDPIPVDGLGYASGSSAMTDVVRGVLGGQGTRVVDARYPNHPDARGHYEVSRRRGGLLWMRTGVRITPLQETGETRKRAELATASWNKPDQRRHLKGR